MSDEIVKPLWRGSVIVLIMATFLARVLAVPVSYKGDPGDALRTAYSHCSTVSWNTRQDSSIHVVHQVTGQNHMTISRARLVNLPLVEHPLIVIPISSHDFLPQPFIALVELIHPPT